MSKLSVVIPAWNEREAIAQVIERTLSVRDALRLEAGVTELEVLVVDDGSTDGTAEVVARVAAGAGDRKRAIRLIRHGANRGYGAALQTGFARARGSLLAFLDADCTYPPEHLPALCQALQTRGTALVLGDRMRSDCSQMPALRWVGNALFAQLVSLLTGTRVADCCSGMRVLSVATWRRLQPLPNGLDFTPAMTVRALHTGLILREVPIPYDERVGRSKLKIVRDGVRFLGTILGETRAHEPGRFWGAAGLATALPLLSLMGAIIALRVTPPWGITLLLGAAAFLAGFSVVGLGMSSRARPAISRLTLPGIVAQSRRVTHGEEERAS